MTETMNRNETSSQHNYASNGSSLGVVTAFFDDRNSAEQAVGRLVEIGLPQSRVGIVREESGDSHAQYADGREEKGFWASVAEMFSTSEQNTYSEGLRRGGYLVTAELSDASQEDRITKILSEAGAVDIDEKSAGWRAQGWNGDNATAASGRSTANSMMGTPGTGARDSADSKQSGQTEEDVIPLAAEELRVGKRETGGRRVRVHTRVVEKPVEEQVTLREEHVNVDRRPASSMSMKQGATDELFQERSVEVQAMREEAVVSKEAHVTEEVVVGKSAGERTETVRDSVRHTEVDIDNGHDGTSESIPAAKGRPPRT